MIVVVHACVWVALVAPWLLAAAAWPDLPERVPLHFDGDGRPDRWGTSTWWAWFRLPAFGTLLGVAMGLVLPRALVAMARRNSRWLNIPHKQQFTALSATARERVVLAAMVWLRLLVCCHQGMLGYLVAGSALVADGRWATLPPAPLYALLAALLACVAGLVRAASRAVRREAGRASD